MRVIIMSEISKGNFKVLYDKNLWSQKKSKKKERQLKIVSVFSVILVFVGIVLTCIVFNALNIKESYGIIIVTFLEILFVLLMIFNVLYAIKKIYGNHVKLYEFMEFFSSCEKIEAGMFNGKLMMHCLFRGNMEHIDIGYFEKKLGDNFCYINTIPKNFGGKINVVVDITKYPYCSLTVKCNSNIENQQMY